jgi:polysaccharide export outer membrane protein
MQTNRTTTHVILVIGLLLVTSVGLLAQATPTVGEARTSPASTATPVDPNQYVIGADDLLQVSILDVAELSGQYRVGVDGKVTLPVLSEPVAATGLTLSQFSDSLAKRLKAAGLVVDPFVNTSVVQSRLHSVAIAGAVKAPQILPVFSQTTLLDLLSQAQGLGDDAGNVAVVRRGDIARNALQANSHTSFTQEEWGSRETETVDLKKLFAGGDSQTNLTIYPGDRVTIPRAGIVYVVGAVNKPGGFTMNSSTRGITVLQALALAEDTTGTALKNQTVILRPDSQSPNGHKQIQVELKKVLGGKSPDPILIADDILFVPDSTAQRALRRGFEAVVQATTGVAIYRGR